MVVCVVGPATRMGTEVVDEAVVRVCVGGSPAPGERCGPVFSSTGGPGPLRERNSRIRSRFLRFGSGIFSNFVVLTRFGW